MPQQPLDNGESGSNFRDALNSMFTELYAHSWSAGNANHTAGSIMEIDWQINDLRSGYDPRTLGGLWSAGTKAHTLEAADFISSDLSDDSGGAMTGGPLYHKLVFTQQNGAEGQVVSSGDIVYASASNTVVYGENTVVFSASGITNVKAVGREVDFQTANPLATGSYADIFNAFNVAHNAGVSLVGGVGGGSWANGYGTSSIRGSHHYVPTGDPVTANSFIDVTNATTFNSAAIMLGSGSGHSIKWSGGSKIYFDGTNQRIVQPSGGVVAIRDSLDANSLITFDTSGNVVLNGGGTINFNSSLSTTSAAAGSQTLPANPVGFLTLNIGGTARKVPYYA